MKECERTQKMLGIQQKSSKKAKERKKKLLIVQLEEKSCDTEAHLLCETPPAAYPRTPNPNLKLQVAEVTDTLGTGKRPFLRAFL
jgi:hypothetical protein